MSNPLLLLVHPAAGGGACGKTHAVREILSRTPAAAGCLTAAAAAATEQNPRFFIK